MKYLWIRANNRICNYHQTQEYTMAAIKPLLSLCQSTRRKVKFPSYSTNFCWPFQCDVSNPVKFLQISWYLLNHSKYNQRSGCLKINRLLMLCTQRCSSPVQRKQPLTYSSGKCCLDKTMTHPDTLLWHWQRSKAGDETWKHNKASEKPSWELTWCIPVAAHVLISHMRGHDSALLENVLHFHAA